MEWPMFFPRISFVFYGEVLSDGADQLYFSPPKPSFGSSIYPKSVLRYFLFHYFHERITRHQQVINQYRIAVVQANTSS
jgi:hypothetical protein